MKVNDVADAVNLFFGNRRGVTHVPMRRGESPGTYLVADVAPLEGLIGGLRCADWNESLAATLSWYADREPAEIDMALATYGVG